MIMPEKEGIETLREIRLLDSAAVVFTISGRNGADEHLQAAGILAARRGVQKPFTMQERLAEIRDSLSHRSEQDASPNFPPRPNSRAKYSGKSWAVQG